MGRTVTLVLLDAGGTLLGALPAYEVPLPYWQEVADVVAGARHRYGIHVDVLRLLGADRVGHGVRAVEDPAVLERLAAAGTHLEVCPASNLALGVTAAAGEHPLPALLDAGCSVSLGADDPLLFRSGLVDQYRIAREELGLGDALLADLARAGIRASAAPPERKAWLLGQIEDWETAVVAQAA